MNRTANYIIYIYDLLSAEFSVLLIAARYRYIHATACTTLIQMNLCHSIVIIVMHTSTHNVLHY